jgi:D-alanyl-D-alanine dipeptidase
MIKVSKNNSIIAVSLLIAFSIGFNVYFVAVVQQQNKKLKEEVDKLQKVSTSETEKEKSAEEEMEGLKNTIEELKNKVKELEIENTKKDNIIKETGMKEINDLVLVNNIDASILIDIRYATANNFLSKVIYNSGVGVIRKETGLKLKQVNEELKGYGYKLKLWDGYRPRSAQQKLWDFLPDPRVVANPSKPCSHTVGAGADVTLVDLNGNEVVMPSGYDDFTAKGDRDFSDVSNTGKENAELLTKVMVKHGFKTISSEWWHYDDVNWKNYSEQDVPLEQFE